MQSVRKLDQNNSNILSHSKEHLTKVLSLHLHLIRSLGCIVPGKLQSLQLGDLNISAAEMARIRKALPDVAIVF